MGWKSFKAAFAIDHIVQVSEDGQGILIGSPYISDLITIDGKTGAITRNPASPEFIDRCYPALLSADPQELVRLINQADEFNESIVVYTEVDGKIVTKLCEETGYPNVTHDGCLMYENTFSIDRNVIVRRTKRSLQRAIKNQMRDVESIERELARVQAQIGKDSGDLAALDREYPDINPGEDD